MTLTVSMWRHSFKAMCAVFFALLLMGVSASAAWAEIPVPRLKPIPTQLSGYLSDQDARIFRSAMSASKKREWVNFEHYRSQISDPVAKDILIWIQAQRDDGVSSEDLSHVVHDMSDWPRMIPIQAKAENRLFETPISPQATLSWFASTTPVSGEGRAALARAHYKVGNVTSGDLWLKKAWREAKLSRDGQKTLFTEFGSRLSPEDHAARADYLIWEGTAHFSKVDGLLPLMNANDRALMDARMRVLANRSGMDAAVNRVPQSLQNDPGLLYARAKWRRQKKTKEDALPLYLEIKTPPASEKGKERIWTERKIMTYWAIKEGRYQDAYNLTQNHGFAEGEEFAEAEFLGGWIALTKLREPLKAARHFKTLRGGVTYPVSVSRAGYWLGRAAEAVNDPSATSHYMDAARFSNTFYGFLAADKIGGGNLLVSLPYESDAILTSGTLHADPRIRAMHILAEAGEEYYYNLLSFHMDDEATSPQQLTLLASMGKQHGYMKPSVRAAKQAARFQTMLTESGYPMPLAILDLPNTYDKPFVLSIARQESEFNLSAVSHAQAHGLMQMINSTARATARKHGVPYDINRLTTDIDYSAKLGAMHLNDLLEEFNGSYILAAVGYNAGPHRVRQWIKAYGDPRTGEIDAVDWLESIPFTETRNYVQRVMENLQVYRARMNGNTAHNQVLQDITQGAL